MKRFSLGFSLVLSLFATSAMAATDLVAGVSGVFNDALMGVIQLLGMVLLALVTIGVKKLLTKFKLEQYEATVMKAADDGILYAEEWARKKASERGYAVAGAEKFNKAYVSVAAKLPFLDSDTVKNAIIVNLAKVRDYGLEAGRASLQAKLDSLQNGNEDVATPTDTLTPSAE